MSNYPYNTYTEEEKKHNRLKWLERRLDEIKDEVKNLAKEYAFLYKAYGEALEHCNQLGAQHCGEDNKCFLNSSGACQPTRAEENIINELEDRLWAAGIDPKSLRY